MNVEEDEGRVRSRVAEIRRKVWYAEYQQKISWFRNTNEGNDSVSWRPELGTKVIRVKKIFKGRTKGPGNELDMAGWGDGGSRFSLG